MFAVSRHPIHAPRNVGPLRYSVVFAKRRWGGRVKQLAMKFRSWGGKRKGAGRKPKGTRAGVPHVPRNSRGECRRT